MPSIKSKVVHDLSARCCGAELGKTTDMGLVCHVVACLLPSFSRYQFILLGNRGTPGTWV